MTTRIKTVTDHLLEAQATLDGSLQAGDNVLPKDALQQALDCIEKALDAIQLVRSETQAALDKF